MEPFRYTEDALIDGKYRNCLRGLLSDLGLHAYKTSDGKYHMEDDQDDEFTHEFTYEECIGLSNFFKEVAQDMGIAKVHVLGDPNLITKLTEAALEGCGVPREMLPSNEETERFMAFTLAQAAYVQTLQSAWKKSCKQKYATVCEHALPTDEERIAEAMRQAEEDQFLRLVPKEFFGDPNPGKERNNTEKEE